MIRIVFAKMRLGVTGQMCHKFNVAANGYAHWVELGRDSRRITHTFDYALLLRSNGRSFSLLLGSPQVHPSQLLPTVPHLQRPLSLVSPGCHLDILYEPYFVQFGKTMA
jgi:hypothetical protein